MASAVSQPASVSIRGCVTQCQAHVAAHLDSRGLSAMPVGYSNECMLVDCADSLYQCWNRIILSPLQYNTIQYNTELLALVHFYVDSSQCLCTMKC